MLKALHSYDGEYPNSLKFRDKDEFLFLRVENEHWIFAMKPNGQFGYIPASYVEINDNPTYTIYRNILDMALSKLSKANITGRDSLLSDVQERKKHVLKGGNPDNLIHKFQNSATLANKTAGSAQNSQSQQQQQQQSNNSQQQKSQLQHQSSRSQSPKPPSSLPAGLAFRLVDGIRTITKAPHENSVETLKFLMQSLSVDVPEIRVWTEPLNSQLEESKPETLRKYFRESLDWQTLTNLFQFLKETTQDRQERGWALHEDPVLVQKLMIQLVQILRSASTQLIRFCLDEHQFRPIEHLISWHQVEKRHLIRRLILTNLALFCEVHPNAANQICMDSVLPVELSRALLNDFKFRNVSSNTLFSNLKSFLLTIKMITLLIGRCSRMNSELAMNVTPDFCASLMRIAETASEINIESGGGGGGSGGGADSSNHNQSATNGGGGDSTDMTDTIREENNNMYDLLCLRDFACVEISDKINNNSFEYLISNVQESVTAFLLAYNRHMTPADLEKNSNPVMRCLLENAPESSRDFIDQVLNAFNRASDPAEITDFAIASSDPNAASRSPAASDASLEQTAGTGRIKRASVSSVSSPSSASAVCTQGANSARKFLCDLFTNSTTADLIYRYDVEVIVDVIIRQLCDLSPANPVINEYFQLLQLLVHTSSLYETSPSGDVIQSGYKLDELRRSLDSVEENAQMLEQGAVPSYTMNTICSLKKMLSSS